MIRYMGTKRQIAHRVRRIVAELSPQGPVVDLFAGAGAVAESLSDTSSIVANDALSFTTVFSRCRFLRGRGDVTVAEAIEQIRAPYREHVERLGALHRAELRTETQAIDDGRAAIDRYMIELEHVGNSETAAVAAARAALETGHDHYQLATLYFSGGYFSLRQAIQLDALRYAIDTGVSSGPIADWMLAAWLSATSTVMNAPGHSAQFLKPTTDAIARRIGRQWRRNVWSEFQSALVEMKPVGSDEWRAGNRVEIGDALDLLRSGRLADVGAVYADPPYTKDQYSRYYHVFETLLRYDYPDSNGAGRIRSDRFNTGFSQKTGVVDAFKTLFDGIAELGVPLVLSYPDRGLLEIVGVTIADLTDHRFDVTVESFGYRHSTMGASDGVQTKLATENLYVCVPA